MKTLLHCTAYAKTADEWRIKHSRWIQGAETGPLKFDTILIPDDGSPEIPQLDGVTIVDEGTLTDVEPIGNKIVYRFHNNLGRQDLFVYPGWYRSFMFAAVYAKKYGYEKVIHVEADACIISQKLGDYFNNFKHGWEALYCPKWGIPETGIQIISGRYLQSFIDLTSMPYEAVAGHPADPRPHQGASWLPYTMNRSFLGDRWSEYPRDVPAQADYACQIPTDYSNCWWLKN
jgi:hypothetical protein